MTRVEAYKNTGAAVKLRKSIKMDLGIWSAKHIIGHIIFSYVYSGQRADMIEVIPTAQSIQIWRNYINIYTGHLSFALDDIELYREFDKKELTSLIEQLEL